QWRDIRGDEDAYRFDLLMTELQTEVLRKSASVADLKARVEGEVERLLKNHAPVKAKAPAIESVRSKEYWTHVTAPKLEELREDLRGVMKYQAATNVPRVGPKVIDVDDADV